MDNCCEKEELDAKQNLHFVSGKDSLFYYTSLVILGKPVNKVGDVDYSQHCFHTQNRKNDSKKYDTRRQKSMMQ